MTGVSQRVFLARTDAGPCLVIQPLLCMERRDAGFKTLTQNRFIFTAVPTFKVCKTLQRQLQDQELLLLGPIPLHGLCPVDVPGKPAGHPGLFAGSTDQAVSPGHPGQGFEEHSGHAVKTQIRTAISVYVLVAIVKKTLKIDSSLYTILQILSVTLFEKAPILQALTDSSDQDSGATSGNQLTLFD